MVNGLFPTSLCKFALPVTYHLLEFQGIIFVDNVCVYENTNGNNTNGITTKPKLNEDPNKLPYKILSFLKYYE